MVIEAKRAWLFEGQGTQYPGMGQDAYANHEDIVTPFYLLAEQLTGIPILDLSFYGSRKELLKTRNAQLAIYTHSAVLLELARKSGLQGFDQLPAHLAGNSLGEFNAYQAAGAYSFEEGLKIVDARATGMSLACEQNPGGLLPTRIDPSDQVKIQELSKDYTVEPAVYSPGQVVVGGPRGKLISLAQYLTVRKPAELLETEGAFHTSFMKPAEPYLADAFGKAEVLPIDDMINVWANAKAQPVRSPEEVIRASMDQLTKTVLWDLTLRKMIDAGVDDFYEIGVKGLFASMIRRAARDKGFKVLASDIITDLGVQVATRVQLLDVA